MTNLPLRTLGSMGVITDADPYDLPSAAFSFGKNVRFEDGKVQRGAVFRQVSHLANVPVHMFSYVTENNTPQMFYVSRGGRVVEYDSNAGETDRSPSGYSDVDNGAPVTSCVLNNVIYVNRPGRVPWWRDKDAASSSFAEIPTATSGTAQWHTDWHTRVLRSMSGVLIAANIQKGANVYPNLVKWSNFSIEPGTVVPDWDYASTTSNAGENTLAEMTGAIIEAYPLRSTMFLYGDSEAWAMEFVGGNDVFRFARRFDKGIIGTNCVVENAGIQYVFGKNDIWMHDGTTDRSLATGKVRRFVYDAMRRDESSHFFVTHNPRLNEVIFCYVSDDAHVKFPALPDKGCNRAVIYNYASQTFYFADLPYVTAASQAAVAQGAAVTFDNVAGTFVNIGGSFSQFDLEVRTNLTFGSDSSETTARALRTFEAYSEVETGFPLDTAANGMSFLERTGIDLDEIKAELRGYKLISSIYPQGRLNNATQAIQFTFGTNDHPAMEVEWGLMQTYDIYNYKLDYNIAGRFLGMRIELNDLAPFTLSGLDLDVTLLGQF